MSIAEIIDLPRPDVIWPDGFEMRKDGLFKVTEHGSHLISAPFSLDALVRSTNGDGWGLLLSWRDNDGRAQQAIVRRTALLGDPKEAVNVLVDRGLRVGRPASVKAALAEADTSKRAILATKPGWHGLTFALGAETFAATNGEPVAFEGDARFDLRGSLDGWRDGVGKLASGNSRVVGAISLAFLGPLLHLADSEGFGLHLRGSSSVGKTTALRAATSVWGVPVGTWRATGNGLEGIAANANDGFLALDELGQVDSREAGEIAYLLANGSGKARAGRSGAARDRASWRCVFLSTGEIGLADKIAENGSRKRIMAGQEVRLLDVPADAGSGHGLFQRLNGAESGAALSRAISRAADANQGHAIRALLRWTAENRTDVADFIAEVRRYVFGELTKGETDGQTLRAADKFALIAAGGEAATDAGITGWEAGQSFEASSILFRAWLTSRGGGGAKEPRADVELIRHFVQRYGAGRFEREAGSEVRDRVGFVTNVRGERCYCFFTETFKNEAAQGRDALAVLRHLGDAGLLISESGRLTVKVRWSGDLLNVYAVKAKIIGGEE